MELGRHIEILLLDNDCVIVPGLGGFIAYHTDARYDAESASFLPPTRIAGFNPKLSMNDNLLAQSYVETYDISYPEAVKRITAEADALKNKLKCDGYFDIQGVGTLRVNDKGVYDFMPFEAGLLTPEYYGLGCFEASDIAASDVKENIDSVDSYEKEKTKFIRIKVSTIRNIAAAAVAVFAFFLLSSPLGSGNQNMASVASLQNSVFYKMMPLEFTHENDTKTIDPSIEKKPIKTVQTTVSILSDSNKIAKEIAKPIAKESKTQKQIKKTEPVTPENYYSIVLASALSKYNAENYVKRLTSDGYKNIHSIDCSNGMKVVCGKFASEKEAYSSLATLRTNKDFKDAWVYKVRAKK